MAVRQPIQVSERERVLAAAAEAEAEAELAAVQSLEASGRLEDAPEGISAEASEAQARAAQLEVQRQGLVREIEGLLAKASLKQVSRPHFRRACCAMPEAPGSLPRCLAPGGGWGGVGCTELTEGEAGGQPKFMAGWEMQEQ